MYCSSKADKPEISGVNHTDLRPSDKTPRPRFSLPSTWFPKSNARTSDALQHGQPRSSMQQWLQTPYDFTASLKWDNYPAAFHPQSNVQAQTATAGSTKGSQYGQKQVANSETKRRLRDFTT